MLRNQRRTTRATTVGPRRFLFSITTCACILTAAAAQTENLRAYAEVIEKGLDRHARVAEAGRTVHARRAHPNEFVSRSDRSRRCAVNGCCGHRSSRWLTDELVRVHPRT